MGRQLVVRLWCVDENMLLKDQENHEFKIFEFFFIICGMKPKSYRQIQV